MAETQALYAQIVPAASRHQPQAGSVWETITLEQALRQLRLATKGFDEARERLQRAVQLVERLTKYQD
jgi:hypothetical protein